MKIYRYNFSTLKNELSMRTLEVEEKEKTYVTVGGQWKYMIKKSCIGVAKFSYPDVELYLLEESEEKAKELFSLEIKRYIEKEKSRIRYMEEEIEELEQIVKKWEREI